MLYHHNPYQWPWDKSQGLWNFTLKFLVKVFFYFSVMKTTKADRWLDFGQPCDIDLRVMNWRSAWPIFHGPLIFLISWRLFDVWTSHFGIMSQYDLTCDLKINVGHSDLYFMVQWVCLISWRLFDVWTSYFGIMSQYDRTFDLKINVGHCVLYFMVQWFYLISWRLFDIWTPYFGIMSQYDPMFDRKVFVAHCDLYFMVQ